MSKEPVSEERAKASSKEQATPAKGAEVPFDAALKQLEAVVDRLEGGDLELEAALASFEEGVRLTQRCAEQLDGAERRVELLMKDAGEWLSKPFSHAPAAADGDPAGFSEDGPAEEDDWEEPDESEELL